MGYIYRLEFPNGKSYIGMTVNPPERRFKAHKANLRMGKYRSLLYNAWRKHGDPFQIVVAEVENELLPDSEIKAIAKFHTMHPYGYNSTIGGDTGSGGLPHVRAKISAAHKGKKASAEARAKMSAAQKLWHETHQVSDSVRRKLSLAHRGKNLTPEHVKKISDANRGKKRSAECRAKNAAIQKAYWATHENWNKGRTLSQETKDKISLAASGKIPSAETRTKRSASMLALKIKRSAKHRAKISAIHKGKVMSAETREKLRIAAKAQWARVKNDARISPTNRADGIQQNAVY
jgi:hypothetical protein